MKTLVGPQAGQQPGQGPDLSGLLQLGQKLSEGILTLAQGVPEIADEMKQCNEILLNALAHVVEGQSGQQPAGAPTSPPSTPVTQSGTQWAGGGFGAGKSF